MPGHHTENHVVVHGVNTCAVPRHTATHPPETDTIDVQWEEASTDHAPHDLHAPASAPSPAADTPSLQAVHDLFNLASQNESISLTVTRTSTAPQRVTETSQTNTETQHQPLPTVTEPGTDNLKTILWTLVGLVAVLVIIKVLEFISTHALSILVGSIIVVCLAGAYRLIQPTRPGGHHE